MTSRRDLIIGAACLVGAGASYGFTPHRRVNLLGSARLADLVPRSFPGWTSRDVSDLIAPKEEDSLASRLYAQTVGRIYTDASTGDELMMLLAYGTTQSDDLQLHRPEICYPAFGYAITQSQPATISLPGGGAIPSRKMLAEGPDRHEAILYWSRLGDYFPVSRREQHLDRTRTSMRGIIADGVLARFSVANAAPVDAFPVLDRFVPGLIRAAPRAGRPVLIGADNARLMAAAGV